MAKPCTPHPIPQAEQFFKPKAVNVGVEGNSPRVLLGDLKGAILSRERMAPFPASPARRRENLPPARHKISAHEHNKENYVAEGGYGAFFGKLRGKHPRAG